MPIIKTLAHTAGVCKCVPPCQPTTPRPAPPMPPQQVRVPIANSASADFSTTYLSSGLRVARGRTGNLFLFGRAPVDRAG